MCLRCGCRPLVELKTARHLVWVGFALALCGYTVYSIIRVTESYKNPNTVFGVVPQYPMSAPGILICPRDATGSLNASQILPIISDDGFDSTCYMRSSAPQPQSKDGVELESQHAPGDLGSRYTADTLELNAALGKHLPEDIVQRHQERLKATVGDVPAKQWCQAKQITYEFENVIAGARQCLDIPAGSVKFWDPHDLIILTFYWYEKNIYRGGNNGLYYGLYADEAGKNKTTPNLAAGAGITVLSFQYFRDTPLSGKANAKYSFTTFSAATAPAFHDAIREGSFGRFAVGTIVVHPETLDMQTRDKVPGYGPADLASGIGGILSLLLGAVAFLQGDDKKPDPGFLRKNVYMHMEQLDAGRFASSLNDDLAELRSSSGAELFMSQQRGKGEPLLNKA